MKKGEVCHTPLPFHKSNSYREPQSPTEPLLHAEIVQGEVPPLASSLGDDFIQTIPNVQIVGMEAQLKPKLLNLPLGGLEVDPPENSHIRLFVRGARPVGLDPVTEFLDDVELIQDRAATTEGFSIFHDLHTLIANGGCQSARESQSTSEGVKKAYVPHHLFSILEHQALVPKRSVERQAELGLIRGGLES